MRIGISCYPTYGGSGIVATELAMALAAGGDEVHVLSYALPTRLSLVNPRLFFHEVVAAHYPLFEYPPWSLALASTMVDVCHHHRLDLLHAHYALPNAVSAVLAKKILAPHPVPVVTTLHGTDVTLIGNDPSYLPTTRWGILESDAVTAVSASLRDATVDQLCLAGKAIEVVPNFIDPERYEQARHHPGARRWAREGEKLLVHISNFRPVKRVLDVVKVFAQVAARLPARLLLVGDGPERARIEQHCREHGDCDRVVFLGNFPAIEEVLVGADLFLLPSETESFGLSALEALSCAVPVVASRAGGLPEVVVDGENGFLRPVGDVDGMAAAALSLLTDPERHRRFAAHGRQWATTRFGKAAIVERYREVYARAIAAARG